jgi:8-oxo-dGTP pyrophosphatase MutT (NUDIX family)
VTIADFSALSDVALRRLIEQSVLKSVPLEVTGLSFAGIAAEQQAALQHLVPAQPMRAAILMPIVLRDAGMTLLFTQRASHLRRHAGQVSFPGGRIERSDDGPLGAALRETEEEIGLPRSFIQPVGYLPTMLVITGYAVTPVVSFVQPGFHLRLDEREVADVFEVPLAHFLDTANHVPRQRQLGEVSATVYDFPFGERLIWGATAGIIMALYRRLTGLLP